MKKIKFSENTTILLFAAVCCFLWGSGYPCIKLCYKSFRIAADDSAGILLFMGIRFTLAGLVVLIAGKLMHHTLLLPSKKSWRNAFLILIFQPVLIHIFFYIGLAHSQGVKSSIMSGLANLLTVLMACYIFRLERMTKEKVIGCILCYAGILVYNLEGGMQSISFMQDGMLFLFAIASGIGYNLIKVFIKDEDVIALSGWQYFIGGILTGIIGILMGGKIQRVELQGILLMIYLVFGASVAFSLWTYLLKKYEVSKVSIYRFMDPFFGVIVSIILLNEKVNIIRTVISLVLVCVGLYAVNKHKKQINKVSI